VTNEEKDALLAKAIRDGADIHMHPDTLAELPMSQTPASPWSGTHIITNALVPRGEWWVVLAGHKVSVFNMKAANVRDADGSGETKR